MAVRETDKAGFVRGVLKPRKGRTLPRMRKVPVKHRVKDKTIAGTDHSFGMYSPDTKKGVAPKSSVRKPTTKRSEKIKRGTTGKKDGGTVRRRSTMHRQAEAHEASKKPFDIEAALEEAAKQRKKKTKEARQKTPVVAKKKKKVKTRSDLHKPYRPLDMYKALGIKKEPFDIEKELRAKGGVIRKKTGGHVVDSYDY